MSFTHAKPRSELIQELVMLMKDYRSGEVAVPTVGHIQRWLEQFEEPEITKTAFLAELMYVLDRTYITEKNAKDFLTGLSTSNAFAGVDPPTFWANTHILSNQLAGNSQTAFRDLLRPILMKTYGINLDSCLSINGPYIYLDDAIFSGIRASNDMELWISTAPKKIDLHIVVLALHSGGSFYAEKKIKDAANKYKKHLKLTIWRALLLESRTNFGAASDVLRMKSFPQDDASKAYMLSFGEGSVPSVLRPTNEASSSRIFRNDAGREILESVFWRAGLKVREQCQHLKITSRPLGYTSTNSANKLGFGSTFVSYRNCPNNAPIALWASSPWYPLFARKIN